MSTKYPAAAVARIAYFASDVVVDSRLPHPATATFASVYQDLSTSPSATDAHTKPVISLPFTADPAYTLQQYTSGQEATVNLISYTTLVHPSLIHKLLPILPSLALPLVLHLALSPSTDLSDVLILRAAVPYFLYSRTAQEAHDHALLASRLARVERKAVVHVFIDAPAEEIEEVEEEKVQPFLVRAKENAPAVNGHVLPLAAYPPALYQSYDDARRATEALTGRRTHALRVSSPLPGAGLIRTVIFALGPVHVPIVEDTLVVDVALVSPLPPSHVLDCVPRDTVERVIVLEQVQRWAAKWTPVYLDIISVLQEELEGVKVLSGVFDVVPGTTIPEDDVRKLVQAAEDAAPTTRLRFGSPKTSIATDGQGQDEVHIPKHEHSYLKLLQQLFGDRLEIANAPDVSNPLASTPEYALGRVQGELEQRKELVTTVQELLADFAIDGALHQLLAKWLEKRDDPAQSKALGEQIVSTLNQVDAELLKNRTVQRVLGLQSHFAARSRWIVGSDSWAYDLGASGLHHAIASGLPVNVLVLDTTPYSQRHQSDPNRRKQDVGLYAMNHGDVYTASIALYASYAQTLHALTEADQYKGPSVVVAYLPYVDEATTALEVLKETKCAVDTGFWPLYRWDPSREDRGEEPFTLDSEAVKRDLQTFLDRQNHLSQLVRAQPQLAAELVGNLGEKVKEARRKKAQQAYSQLLTAIDAPPLLIVYGSDSGKAEKVARRLAARGKLRGLSTTVAPMDQYTAEDLKKEEYIVFITSVAGQGEFPQNARSLVKAMNALAAQGEKSVLEGLKFGVFGMGDSHYWPRPEDKHYYNKAGKDLDARLASLGAERVVPLGLGDDQDADGPETGYKAWEPLVWKVLGVDNVEVHEAEPEPITNEHIKAASNYLRGTIVEGLEDDSTGALSAADGQLTKFHGTYQQDDRDIRDERQAAGVEPAYMFMIRCRMPGGVCTPVQWLALDRVADEHGNGTLKITTRQTFQFHGVIKKHLKKAMQGINRSLLDTLAACGDVNRNVITTAIPSRSKLHRETYEFAKAASEHLKPRTTAYHEIWLDRKMVAGEALKDVEPLYGEFYLPRKFKIAVAVPPNNDVDLFANDVGFIAIVGKDGELEGFNVTAGGGMGVTHGSKKTYPRLGDVLGYVPKAQGIDVAEKIMLVQRDNGNRQDRKNARLKYTIDRMGLDNFKAEVEKRLGYQFQPARPYTFDRNIDDFGWVKGENGKHNFTCFIENGRIQDEPGLDFKTGLREIAKVHKGTFRLTANQHLVLADVPEEELSTIKDLLAKFKLDNLSHTGLRLSSSACVAFPTCGLAMAESERYLPILIDKVEKICEENGLRNDAIIMRMTGCPNGCARPYVAEIAFVGKAPGTYMMLLGGGYYGQRLNKIYRESVTEPEILAILRPMIKHYALERLEGEHFGDFVIRAGYIAPTESGISWWDRAGGEGKHREAANAA